MMLRLCVSTSFCIVLAVSFCGQSDEKGSAAGTKQVADHPPAPSPRKREKAIVLPARTNRDSDVESSVIEVLITAGLEYSGIRVLDRRERSAKCPEKSKLLARAREKYLDMEMEAALELAEEVRDAQLDAFGDLLGCADLTEAELFMVQIFLDIGEREKAFSMARSILARDANIRLDPAKYTPAVLALWDEAAKRMSPGADKEVNPHRLARLAQDVEVNWVVIGVCWYCGMDGKPLAILAVPSGAPEKTYRGEVTLGSESQWALRVRENLAVPFPPPVLPDGPDMESTRLSQTARKQDSTLKRPWYKTWWFWTVVGAVVVGGTAGAIGGYYANADESSTRVTSKLNW